jgi:hypothetical protein
MMKKNTVPYMDFVGPMILKILKMSKIPMTTLSINYHVNEIAGKTINLNVIKSNLTFFVNHKKISEKIDEENGIAYYKLIV